MTWRLLLHDASRTKIIAATGKKIFSAGEITVVSVYAKLNKISLTLPNKQLSRNFYLMESVFSKQFFLSASETNPEQEMSLPLLATKMIDIATLHANSLGIGNPSLKEFHAGWVLSRLTIDMKSYPKVNDTYKISTWVESYNRHFSIRCFSIVDPEGKTYGYGRSIWMIMDTRTHTNVPLSVVPLPETAISGEVAPIPYQAKHITIIPEGTIQSDSKKFIVANRPTAFYQFKYCDLDSYRHVNTVRYVELLLNRFSLEEFDKKFVTRLELSFLHEAKFGMEISILRSDVSEENLSNFQLSNNDDGSPIMFARIFLKDRETK